MTNDINVAGAIDIIINDVKAAQEIWSHPAACAHFTTMALWRTQSLIKYLELRERS